MRPPADFRSDTVTRPTAGMREAMATAEVGDDVMGEDPTIHRLEAAAARALGQEAALFVPSGTMANQIAIHVWCRPGDEILCEERAHVFQYEAGGAARWTGAQVRPLPGGEAGFPAVEAVLGGIRKDDPHLPRSRLLVLENTHNMAGGRVLDVAGMGERIDAARAAGLKVHVDGARLFNAAVALGVELASLGGLSDSVSLCLSKGLGAPVGSVVAGSEAFVAEGRRARKALGGGMRQAGILAAAGLLALEEGRETLTRDHANAAALAEGLQGLPGLEVAPVETNIVMVDCAAPASEILSWLAEHHGVLALPTLPHRIRFVTHRDLDDSAVSRCVDGLRAWTRENPSPRP